MLDVSKQNTLSKLTLGDLNKIILRKDEKALAKSASTPELSRAIARAKSAVK